MDPNTLLPLHYPTGRPPTAAAPQHQQVGQPQPAPYLMPPATQGRPTFLPPGMVMVPRGFPVTSPQTSPPHPPTGAQALPAPGAPYYHTQVPMMMVPTTNIPMSSQQPQQPQPILDPRMIRPAPVPRQSSSSSTCSSSTGVVIPPPSPMSLFPSPEDYNEIFADPRLYDDCADSGISGSSSVTRKRSRRSDARVVSEAEITMRKERNKAHAKRSRLRRKFLLESLRDQLVGLRKVNTSLRQIVKHKLGQDAPKVFEECCAEQSPIFEDIVKKGEGTLQESDLKLMTALQTAQQCFTVSAANAPGLPIVYASEGFLQLTGYEASQVIGRPALFLKGEGTNARDLQLLEQAATDCCDSSVCLVSYKADGTAFWDQCFIAPVCDAQDTPMFYIVVHCEVEQSALEAELQAVIRNTRVEDMEESMAQEATGTGGAASGSASVASSSGGGVPPARVK